ncbi:hypothetical protein Ciccas_008046 [Cichlidogyrus casuarinus]|uniref:Uncharacterized protein n=1 Tax=Cichlidogyrus casuarinus TaxID=1844966 RepID=A0ABD2Q1V4_9PLAT
MHNDPDIFDRHFSNANMLSAQHSISDRQSSSIGTNKSATDLCTNSTTMRVPCQMAHGPSSVSVNSSIICGPNSGGTAASEPWNTVRGLARQTLNLGLPGLNPNANKSLMIFSEENLIRKFVKTIIEWGYPFHLLALTF